jgi:hypothetical protein
MSRRKTTRRDFAKTLAVLTAAPLTVAAQTAGPPRPRTDDVAAEALIDFLRMRYGAHLSPEQLQRLRRLHLPRALRSAERLRDFPLTSADEPALLFSADIP